MVVFILENAPPSLRGELSRWLFEIKAGVFTGKISALVREELWMVISQKLGTGSAVLIFPADTEQGFRARLLGNPSRRLIDIEGLLLVRT